MQVTEMQACTFAPHRISPHRAPPAGPILVRGLGRHLELRDAARAAAADRAAREAAAFSVKPGAQRRTAAGLTVPAPFVLSSGAQGKWAARREQQAAQRAVECPFVPRTGAAERAAAVAQLLQEEASSAQWS
jgi:hypothetical protein